MHDLLIVCLGGIPFGLLMWSIQQWRFRRMDREHEARMERFREEQEVRNQVMQRRQNRDKPDDPSSSLAKV